MRVIVTGGRDYADRAAVDRALHAVNVDEEAISLVYHGGATGADALAEEWCRRNGVPFCVVPAMWEKHGKSAGPKRNAKMVNLAVAFGSLRLICLAFPGGRGTANCVSLCEQAGIPVRRIA